MPSPEDHGNDAGSGPESGFNSSPRQEQHKHNHQSQQSHLHPQPQKLPGKRSRILLSCAPCRTSKLKCDRQQPCGQCLKKGRTDGCLYAPKPEKPAPAPRSMTARLKRLESMVRDMMDGGGTDADGVLTLMRQRQRLLDQQKRQQNGLAQGSGTSSVEEGQDEECDSQEAVHAQVILGKGTTTTTYVGATHFMAMLDDIEDLKSYFEDNSDEGNNNSTDTTIETHNSEMIILSGGSMTRQDILDALPPRQIADIIVHRYFSANSPTEHLVHRPTFVKEYHEFWQDPHKAPMDWIALLMSIISMGAFFSTYVAPTEMDSPGGTPPMERFRRFHAATASALVAAKYTSPTCVIIQALLMHLGTEFISNRSSQTNCYLLSSTAMRLMLKMGFHRDASKLPNLSPFHGEMRRRMWALGVQIELLVSFHMGLPSMVYGLETDAALPSNLFDDDFTEDMAALPPPRPDTEFTPLTYPRWKSTICVIFGDIARQVSLLTVPSYSEVMRLDNILEEKWKQLPSVLKLKPLVESIADPLAQIHQRFGLASLYQKSRCVLHRRYLTEAVPRKEHAYSRQSCIEAAMSMLEYQEIIHLATLPGGMLRQHGWFLTTIATYDYLLAAMIIFVVLQSDMYSEDGAYDGWAELGNSKPPSPGRHELHAALKNSYQIWVAIAHDAPEAKKAADILEVMLGKIDEANVAEDSQVGSNANRTQQGISIASWRHQMALSSGEADNPIPGLSISDEHWKSQFCPGQPSMMTPQQRDLSRNEMVTRQPPTTPGESNLDGTPWLDLGTGLNEVDWSTFDSAMGGGDTVSGWIQQGGPPIDARFMTMGYPYP
ncbi:fungal-specific transcription factor domain-containing protein [Lasiosphaeris hirsuta]|uniref:Fungal-specific transcription factor domain-containing protein n=1 Tax=Lasiosphaeris hirsuta TaxID=260670 RepID=A0AA40DXJ0_9PEZI|nr:fungal-specific transcription factor domain-containing protein [Lasiosphaeris hirsuta]